MTAPISGTSPLLSGALHSSSAPNPADAGDVQRFSQAMSAGNALNPADAPSTPDASGAVAMDDFWKAFPDAIVRMNMQRMSDATQKIKESFEG
jgi:hypothetical protein